MGLCFQSKWQKRTVGNLHAADGYHPQPWKLRYLQWFSSGARGHTTQHAAQYVRWSYAIVGISRRSNLLYASLSGEHMFTTVLTTVFSLLVVYSRVLNFITLILLYLWFCRSIVFGQCGKIATTMTPDPRPKKTCRCMVTVGVIHLKLAWMQECCTDILVWSEKKIQRKWLKRGIRSSTHQSHFTHQPPWMWVYLLNSLILSSFLYLTAVQFNFIFYEKNFYA